MMTQLFKIPDQATKFILFQRTGYLTYSNMLPFRALRKILPGFGYNHLIALEAKARKAEIEAMYLEDMKKEYESIKEYLPKNCLKLLDIGCGIAGIDVFLNEHYQATGDQIDLYLLDKSHVEKKVFYMFEEQGAFYNSLDVARDLLVQNGIAHDRIHLLEATDNNDIEIDGDVDLIISLISWGFHYPVGTYLDKVYEILKQGGTLMLDIRKNTSGLDLLIQKFSHIESIVEREKYNRVRAIK